MRRWPAEWEKHDATWIAWPHHEPDWPGKLAPIPWVYAEIVRVLHRHERVEILCHDESVRQSATSHLRAHGIDEKRVRLHLVPTDRVWLRDSSPIWVEHDGHLELVNWRFNAWAKYDNYSLDEKVGEAIARITGVPRAEPQRPDGKGRVVLEGGAIDTDGQGTLLTTEECLLSDVQARNAGLTRERYELIFREWLGIRETIWLGEGCVGDDTHGHVDDVARFVAPDVIVLAYEEDPSDENHLRSHDNMRRLQLVGAADGVLKVVKLPFPRPVVMNGERLPASYVNFYVANRVVLVPTFNDRNDRTTLNTLAELMPDREVIGIHAVDLVWGLGTLHCLTQQQPVAPGPVRPDPNRTKRSTSLL
jgi:agmatine deiminase